MSILTSLLIVAGFAIMLFSILHFHRLIEICRAEAYKMDKKKKKLTYLSCLSLMYMFAAGYLGVLFLVLGTEFSYVYLLVAAIFFFGSVFVGAMVHALRFMNKNLTRKNHEMMEIFVAGMEMKDVYTKGHSKHVQAIVSLFYDALPAEYRHKISKGKLLDAALLHDIGKMWVRDAVLQKPGSLEQEEWENMKMHPQNGKRILEKTVYDEISDWVYFHHERMDGCGYYKIPGEKIPVEARIISIADTFSALTTDRVYRKRYSYAKAVDILQKASGSQFDPVLIEYFKEIDPEVLEELSESFSALHSYSYEKTLPKAKKIQERVVLPRPLLEAI